MLGLEGILAITGVAFQVIAAVDKVILIFDRAQNAPDELHHFRGSVSRLERCAKKLELQLQSTNFNFDESHDLLDIKETLQLCKAFFDEYETRQSSRRTAWRAMWSPTDSTTLERHQKRIDRHFLQIIHPLWCEAIVSVQSRASVLQLPQDVTGGQQMGQSQTPHSEQPEIAYTSAISASGDTILSEQDVHEFKEGISELRDVQPGDDKATVERIRRRLDQSLMNCWRKLGLPVEEDELFTTIPATGRRLSTEAFENAPTTITLEGAAEQHRTLELGRIHIMARDDKTRILRYYSNDMSIKLTHIIPYGSIPWSQTQTSKTISFLAPHTITVIDHDVYHIYYLVPSYKFHASKHCRTFQETFRERDYLGTPHETVQIVEGKRLTATQQVVKFWKKQDTKEVTLTFLASSVSDFHTHWELNVRLFANEIVYVVSPLSRKKESNEVKLRSRRDEPSIHFIFASVEDAKAFKKHYEEIHPNNALAPQLQIPEPISSGASSNASLAHGAAPGQPNPRADSFVTEWEELFVKDTDG